MPSSRTKLPLTPQRQETIQTRTCKNFDKIRRKHDPRTHKICAVSMEVKEKNQSSLNRIENVSNYANSTNFRKMETDGLSSPSYTAPSSPFLYPPSSIPAHVS